MFIRCSALILCSTTTDLSAFIPLYFNVMACLSSLAGFLQDLVHTWKPKTKGILHSSQKVCVLFCWDVYSLDVVDVVAQQKVADPVGCDLHIWCSRHSH
jgi:hypothetical protein